ncbi:MAG: cytochrome c [Bryobacteraceae bacterium]|nr:cytochrome c [Bryobacteraceae bacterium]
MRIAAAAALLAAAASMLRAGEVTWAKDIAPIVFNNCSSCHRPGDVAPMSFLKYSEVRPWAKSIREAVATRKMPPWHADPKIGHFANDPRLTDAQIAAIRTWVEQGAKEGNPADAPAPPKFTEGWHNGQPDVVFQIPEVYVVKANSTDQNTRFVVKTNFDKDVWVQSVELRPGNRKVVHHAHLLVSGVARKPRTPAPVDPEFDRKKLIYNDAWGSHMRLEAPIIDDGCAHPFGGDFPRSPDDNGALGVLASYLPGKTPDQWPVGFAKKIPAGAEIEFAIHYASGSGKEETDRTSVGLIFAKEPPKMEVKRRDIHNQFFRIPAGASEHPVSACFTLDESIDLLSYTPHMHYRGKSMKMEVTRPGGKPEVIINIPAYSFEWQTQFRYKEPVTLPKGTVVRIDATYDNSKNNAANPNAAETVRWGSNTASEMMDGWLEYIARN